MLLIPIFGIGQPTARDGMPERRFTPGIGIPPEAVTFGVKPLAGQIEWLREEVDPIQRARRQIHLAMRERALERALEIAEENPRSTQPRDPAIEWGDWRFSVGNNGNWSPYPDRELDARNIRFPLRMKSDNRTEADKALEQMRQKRGQ